MKEKTVTLDTTGIEAVKSQTDEMVRKEFGKEMECLSWHDLKNGKSSPKDAANCQNDADCDRHAKAYGADVRVKVNDGDYLLYYKEFEPKR